MSDEPYYTDDPWGDSPESWQRARTIKSNVFPLLIRAMNTCRRTSHTFQSHAEQKKWVRIAKMFDEGRMREEWIINRIEIAEEKNREHRYGVAISFKHLTGMILNKAAMTDWNAKNPEEGKAVIIKIDTSKGHSGE